MASSRKGKASKEAKAKKVKSPERESGSDTTDKIPLKKRSLIESIKAGATVKKACELAKVSRDTFYRWFATDDKFFQEIEIAKESRIQIAEDALLETVQKGNVAAIVFLLCNKAGERWKNIQKVEAIGEERKRIEVVIHDAKVDGKKASQKKK